MKPQAEIGIIGLGVMGKSLALNFCEKKIPVAVYNRTLAGVEEHVVTDFLHSHPDPHLTGSEEIGEFVHSLKAPRKILLMIKAGDAIDHTIRLLEEHLQPGDLVLDGGNSHYKDTQRRIDYLKSKEILFFGVGISGGEEGALKGPSIMPGGQKEGYAHIGPLLEKIAAGDKDGGSCCEYIGPGGAGHFVKMVHNGIEYAEMQLLAECYDLLKRVNQRSNAEIASLFTTWQQKGLDSFLLEITIDILQYKKNAVYLLDEILDAAGQKGTGGWSTAAALELGSPLSTISEAVMARIISSRKMLRKEIGMEVFPAERINEEALMKAYSAARLINHGVGFDFMEEASCQFGWKLNLSEIARIWTNGCIIRSALMEQLVLTLRSSRLIWTDQKVKSSLKEEYGYLAEVVAKSLTTGVAVPVFSAAINHFLGLTTAESSANLIQAQRDYFGAHTYQKKNDPSGNYYHTEWSDQS